MALSMGYEPPDFYEFEVSPDLHTPSNSSVMKSPFPEIVNLSGVDSTVENLKTALMAASVLSFIFLISMDAHKAFMRRAHWIPCDFLVLSAFSIQLLNMLNTENQPSGATSSNARFSIKVNTPNVPQTAQWKDFVMIHNSRTVLCVFTAYVMPAMADPGLEHAWVRWVALVITVFHHVTSQYYSAKGTSSSQGASPANDSSELPNFLRLWPESNSKSPEAPYYVYATIISLSFSLLILLLACATIAGRSIERIVTKKISLVLRGEGEFCAGIAEKSEEVNAHHPPHHHSCCRTVKFDVKRTNHHYQLHHVHDQSCLQTDEEAVLRVEKGDEEAVVRGKNAEEEYYRPYCHYCWHTVEDAVLKAWIIVRAYSVQPVLARSALTASAAIIVTIQIVITIVGGLSKVLKLNNLVGQNNPVEKNKFKLVATIVQSIFILLAWALINFRWAIAAVNDQRPETDTWRSALRIEDFWTRHLKELQQAGESPLEEAQSLDSQIEQLVSKKQRTRTVASKLLYAVIWLQLLLVSFSKACWLASLMILHNKLTHKLFKFMFGKHILCVFEDYPKYEKILKDVQMLGESPNSLWVANHKSIQEAKSLIIQGNQDGEYSCESLLSFLSSKKRVSGLEMSCLDPYKPQIGLKFLCKKRSTQQPQEESDLEKQQSQRPKTEQFADVTTTSWKMAAVSLLRIIVYLSPFYPVASQEIPAEGVKNCSKPDTEAGGIKKLLQSLSRIVRRQTQKLEPKKNGPPEAVKHCLEAYTQAWEIIDFVEADTETDGITSEAADIYFQDLLKKVEKEDCPTSNCRDATPQRVREALEELKENSKIKTEPSESANCISRLINRCKGGKQGRPKASKGKDSIYWKQSEKTKTAPLESANGEKKGRPGGWNGDDSIDWKTSASGSAVYNLCNSIECNDITDVSKLLKELESSLAGIINKCLEEAQHLLLLKSRKWALNRDEKRMAKALYTAGKAKVIMEKLACNKLAIVSCR